MVIFRLRNNASSKQYFLNTMSDKELTGIKEEARGFVGRSPLFDMTKNGRPRIRLDVYCGENKPENGKYSILRHCVGYDDLAEKLRDVKGGMYFSGYGWLSKETLKDEYGRTVMAGENPQMVERLILWRGEYREHEKLAVEQLPLARELVEA